MTTSVATQEGLPAKQEVPTRERYKSRREDRKPGDEEIETMRTDKLFAKRSESNLAVRTCGLIVDPRLPDSAIFSRVRLEKKRNAFSKLFQIYVCNSRLD